MSGMPKQRHPLSKLSSTTRQFLKHSASSLGKQQILPKALRKRLIRLGQVKNTSPHSNRRKRTTPELQEYIKNLQGKEIDKQVIRDFRELAHYAYVFDIEHYKSQLDPEEAEELQSIGDVIFHYCSSGSR